MNCPEEETAGELAPQDLDLETKRGVIIRGGLSHIKVTGSVLDSAMFLLLLSLFPGKFPEILS